jgi:nucleoside-diphosphate-sugar epimerase
MRVFITGASGHIGCAVIPELLEARHEIVGFARPDTSAAALEALGGGGSHVSDKAPVAPAYYVTT